MTQLVFCKPLYKAYDKLIACQLNYPTLGQEDLHTYKQICSSVDARLLYSDRPIAYLLAQAF